MRFHGLVTLAVLALIPALFAQDYSAPRSLDAAPELNSVPLPAVPLPGASPSGPLSPPPAPGRPSGFNGETDTLEGELEALRADLRSFHSLSDEVARSARAAEADADRTMIRQRQEMLDILTKLATQGLAKKAEKPERSKRTQPVLSANPEAIATPAVTDSAVDPFALGKSLFRAGDYVKAEQAFRKVVVNDDNRLMVKYLIASCLRKRSQWQGAIEAYREVAASDKDPVLRDLANFQLDGIRWNQDTEKQIEQLRKQRERQLIPSKNQP